MKRSRIPFLLVLSLSVLAGCWDQRLLKDNHLVMCGGIDPGEEGAIELSMSTFTGKAAKEKGIIETAIGHTVRNARAGIDFKIEKTADNSELQMILLNEELARQSILGPLNILYRDRLSNFGAKIAIVKGSAKAVMEAVAKRDPLVGPYLAELVVSLEKDSILPRENVGTIGDIIPQPGKDLLLPYIELKEGESQFSGTAIIHDDRMTGTLRSEESLLAVLFTKDKPKVAKLTLKVKENQTLKSNNYMTLGILNADTKIKIGVKDRRHITVKLDNAVTAYVQEYNGKDLNAETKIAEWNRKLSELVTEKATAVIEKLRQGNCDLYGIGARIRAFHPEVWKSLDWEKDFPDVRFVVSVKVKINHTGSIN
ncbi:Ger(x)C family spore germination protein [Paenibacillus montanisoli]|uniref:Ger(X)C family spore germination protein n=1 Tax=Paenibacillus montanisoli TaxID=2081970 RepID=A0A328UC32_9BACL|nr:Ger(x)C family spore germination protein [Paenibacillus montanisoli]RAP77566.1 hypothetical protein DL346_03550 [Paenibacillus montanisoli]